MAVVKEGRFVARVAQKINGARARAELKQEIRINIPKNLSLTITVSGSDSNNINGDGSGTISCKATALDAVSYGFKIGSGAEVKNSSGEFPYTFTEEGVHEYIVSVFAYSSTGNSVGEFKKITVYVAEKGPQLVWSDEFDTDGAPDASKWIYDLGNGCPGNCGWGNGEKQ